MRNRLFAFPAALFLLVASPDCVFADDAKSELKTLVVSIQATIKTGPRTEAALAGELAQFDKLLAAHQGEKTDDVAQILFMKATLYTQVLNNGAKGVELLKQLKADFPDSMQATRVDSMLKSMEAQAGLAIGKPFPDF
jgi:Tfp pilus assembly protein PilN